MTHYVQIVDGEVKQVWDTPPSDGVGNNGWRNAIEVRPTIIPYRQGYTPHRFDLNADPVQIIWDTFDVTVDERKQSMKMSANMTYKIMENQKQMDTNAFTDSEMTDALTARDTQLAAIDISISHDALDLLQQ
jgi:hypothetical protein